MNRQKNVQRLLMTDEAILGLIHDFLDSRNLKNTAKSLEKECKESKEEETKELEDDAERPKSKPKITELEELLLQAKGSSPSLRKPKVVILPESELDYLNNEQYVSSSSASHSTPLSSSKLNLVSVEFDDPEDEEKETGRNASVVLRGRSSSNEKWNNGEEDSSLVSFLNSTSAQDQNEDNNTEILKSISFEDQEGEQSHHSQSSHGQERSKRDHISFDEPHSSSSQEEMHPRLSFSPKRLRGTQSMVNLSDDRRYTSPPPKRMASSNRNLLSPVITNRHSRSKSESYAHAHKTEFSDLPQIIVDKHEGISNKSRFLRNLSPPPVTFSLASSQEGEEPKKKSPIVTVHKSPSFAIEEDEDTTDSESNNYTPRSGGLSTNRPVSRSDSVSSILRMRSSSAGSARSSKSVSFRGESGSESENYDEEEGEQEEEEWDEDEMGYTKVHMDDFEIEQLLRYHQQEIEDSIIDELEEKENIEENINRAKESQENKEGHSDEIEDVSDSSQEGKDEEKEEEEKEDKESDEEDSDEQKVDDEEDDSEMQVSSISENASDEERDDEEEDEDEDGGESEENEEIEEKVVTVAESPLKPDNTGPLSQFFRFLSGFGGNTSLSDVASVQSEVSQDDDHYEYSYNGIEYETFGLPIVRIKRTTGLEESKDYRIIPGTVIAGRYQIVKVLGSAAFSTAVECIDCATGQHNCVKIIKNNKEFFDQSLDEIKLLQYLNSHGNADQNHVLQIYDYFYHKEHLFVVTELLQQNLYEVSKRPPILQSQLSELGHPTPYFTLERIKLISKQLLRSLQFVHSLGVIHCDLKPENILIKDIEKCEVKIIDFGSSCFVTDHLSSYVQSRSYRAPEVILGLPYAQKIDIWSLGCVLAELWTGNVLFQNESVVTLLAKIAGALGNFDPSLLQRAKYRSKFFTKNGTLYEETKTTYFAIKPKKTSLKARLKCDDDRFVDFISKLLTVNSMNRPTASEALRHEWLNS